MRTPEFTIIIPAHNEENYIRKTLHAVKTQTFQNFETIVVSNGSNDKTDEIVKKRQNDKFSLFSLNEANVSKARNYGAFKAKGRILLFLDADTILEKDALKKVKDNFTKKYSVATTKVFPEENKFKYHLALQFKNFYHKTKLYQGCSGVLVCRKEDFDRVNGYPEIIVKEHRKLIIKLKRETKKEFKCLDISVRTSMRRFNKWGLTKATFFWIKQWGKDYFSDLKESNYDKIR